MAEPDDPRRLSQLEQLNDFMDPSERFDSHALSTKSPLIPR